MNNEQLEAYEKLGRETLKYTNQQWRKDRTFKREEMEALKNRSLILISNGLHLNNTDDCDITKEQIERIEAEQEKALKEIFEIRRGLKEISNGTQ